MWSDYYEKVLKMYMNISIIVIIILLYSNRKDLIVGALIPK